MSPPLPYGVEGPGVSGKDGRQVHRRVETGVVVGVVDRDTVDGPLTLGPLQGPL